MTRPPKDDFLICTTPLTTIEQLTVMLGLPRKVHTTRTDSLTTRRAYGMNLLPAWRLPKGKVKLIFLRSKKSIVYLKRTETTGDLQAGMCRFLDSYTEKWKVLLGLTSNQLNCTSLQT
jgi:hypothetical protein